MEKSKAAETFISVANVSSELFNAQKIARELSIISKNARALAVRAGSTAAGFNEITRFIEGLAAITISTASSVNQLAIALTKYASDLFRVESVVQKIERVHAHEHTRDDQLLMRVYEGILDNRNALSEKIFHQVKELQYQIDDARNELRSTQVVSVVAKVEAASALADFQDSLRAVAEEVESAGERINTHLKSAQEYLSVLD